MSAPREVPALQRAALLVLPVARAELDRMGQAADEADRDRVAAGRGYDAQRDATERAVRLSAEWLGAQRIVILLGDLARGARSV